MRALVFAWAAAACAAASRVQRQKPARLLIDTDMSTDVDDVLAIAIAHQLEETHEAEVLGVVHNTGLDGGVGAVSVINRHYGRDDVPLGAYKGRFNDPTVDPDPWVRKNAAGPYVAELLRKFPSPVRNRSQVPDALTTYRRLLAAQAQRSVTIVSIGFFGNLAELLASGPDEHSPLSGRALVEHAVQELVVMGGRFPDSGLGKYEWNFGGGCEYDSPRCPWTPQWTKEVVDTWPAAVPMTFSGAEVGERVLLGGRIEACLPETSPVRAAILLYRPPPLKSWDPVTLLYAVRGLGAHLLRSERGSASIDGTDGSNRWVPVADGHQSYLQLRSQDAADALAREIEDLVCSHASAALQA